MVEFVEAMYGLALWLHQHNLDKDCRIVVSFPDIDAKIRAELQLCHEMNRANQYTPGIFEPYNNIVLFEVAGVDIRLESRQDH